MAQPRGVNAATLGSSPHARPRPRRRHWSALILLLPIVEILGIILVGNWVGALPTLLALLVTGIVGALLIRREGRRTYRSLQSASRGGGRISVDLADSGLVLLAGLLLLVPGFLSDVAGLLLLIPAVRPVTRVWLRTAILRRASAQAAAAGVPFPAGATERRGPGRTGGGRRTPDAAPDVIEGEILDEEPPPGR